MKQKVFAGYATHKPTGEKARLGAWRLEEGAWANIKYGLEYDPEEVEITVVEEVIEVEDYDYDDWGGWEPWVFEAKRG
jgi:hypothetical protein